MGARPRYQVFFFGLARALDKGSGVFVCCVSLHVVVVLALGCCSSGRFSCFSGWSGDLCGGAVLIALALASDVLVLALTLALALAALVARGSGR